MIPMGIIPPDLEKYSLYVLREKYQIPQDRFVIGAYGYVSPGKRIPELLRAFAAFAQHVPEALCVLVGHLVDPEELPGFDMRRLIRESGIEDKVMITGFTPYHQFLDYIALADVCVNLRHPTVRATSANILKIMAFAKPILISDLCESLDLPPSCCMKIPPNEIEEEALFQAFQKLYQDTEYRKTLGANARKYIEEHHTVAQAAEKISGLLFKNLVHLKKVIAGVGHRNRRNRVFLKTRFLRHTKEKYHDSLPLYCQVCGLYSDPSCLRGILASCQKKEYTIHENILQELESLRDSFDAALEFQDGHLKQPGGTAVTYYTELSQKSRALCGITSKTERSRRDLRSCGWR